MSEGYIGLIPARSGSIRIPDKNIQLLGGRPLLYWAIRSALDSGVFDRVIVSTDSGDYASKAESYGAEVIIEPLPTGRGDIKWVKNVFNQIGGISVFSILRPTSPFRTKDTIIRAWRLFNSIECDSLRAVEPCTQTPYKMWRIHGHYMTPLLKGSNPSMPSQSYPVVYVQNASLEIAHARCVHVFGSIHGQRIIPFFTEGYEGFDVNVLYDIRYAEWLIETGQVKLQEVK